MFLFLYILWICWNGKVTAEICILGVLICAVLYFGMYRFMGYRPGKALQMLRHIPGILSYLCYLLAEIIKANIEVTKVILDFEHDPEPLMVRFRTKVRSEGGQVAVANSITLTPGTLTVSVRDGEYLVHSLKREYIENIDTSGFGERVVQMEEE